MQVWSMYACCIWNQCVQKRIFQKYWWRCAGETARNKEHWQRKRTGKPKIQRWMKRNWIFNTESKKEVSGCWGKEVDPLLNGRKQFSLKKTCLIIFRFYKGNGRIPRDIYAFRCENGNNFLCVSAYVHKHLYYSKIFFIVLTMFLAQNILWFC